MTKAQPTRETIVDFIGDIFERRGAEEYLGEPVTIGQHMLQCAQLAEEGGASDEIVVAALLHDIGHFTSEFGTFTMEDEHDRLHEDAGAVLLKPYFPSIVVDCVQYHVAAKRYLCAVKPDYFARLSEASVKSLELQGGPMNEAEVADFEANPNREAIVQVRYMDEAAKDASRETPDYWHYAPKVKAVLLP